MGSFRKSLIILTICFGVLGAITVEEKQAELQDVQAELQRQQYLLQQARKKEQSSLRDLFVINKKVTRVKNDLSYNQWRLQNTDQTLQKTRDDLEKTKSEFQQRQDVLAKRVAEIYKSQDLGFLALFFSRKSFSEIVDSTFYYRKVMEQDVANMTELSSLKLNIQYKETQLQSQRRQIEDTHRVIRQQKAYYETKAQEQRNVYASVKAQRQEYEKRVDGLLRNSKEIEKMIKSLMSQSREARGTGQFVWPARGMITSYYGRRRHPIFRVIKMHTGIDLAINTGTPIKASDSGVVIFSGWWGGYGRAIIVDHGRGYSTVYAHLSRQYVRAGQRVDKHQVIALSGNTGYSTGPHLHFEVRVKGETRDPLKYLR